MAAPAANTNAVPLDTLITIKVSVNDNNLKKLKLPLRDLSATILLDRLRALLAFKPEQTVVFERFSDSAGGYITLDPNNPQVFKTLIRAAKAKLKLRLKATVTPVEEAVLEEEKAVAQEMAAEKVPQKAMEPVIVRSPVYQTPTPRESLVADRRNIGSGIFEFREARGSQQTLVEPTEAPVPQPFSTAKEEMKTFFADLAERGLRAGPTVLNNGHPWSVFCNACDVAMVDAHFHCSICDGGDYDLCERCVNNGKLCPGEGHWLIKRFIKDGKVINSTTERISPRKASPVSVVEPEVKKEIPGAFTDETKTLTDEPVAPTRTCNSCVIVLPENCFVTCANCEDFDLCTTCHSGNKHGHHPAHEFKQATDDTVLPLASQAMLAPGRNARHNAICDGCDKKIQGVRHKCLNCPDWDYCNDCVKQARTTHPRHRFAAIYDPIGDPHSSYIRHFGIYCDGPLCNGKEEQSYITGVRYKCAVCHDTDFCASCEALPSNTHNRTHPLIKFKTPVRNVSITTENEDTRGQMRVMGDRREQAQSETKSTSTETSPVPQVNAATQVQTVAEIKPTLSREVSIPTPSVEMKKTPSVVSTSSQGTIPSTVLNAHFVKDSVPDGMVVTPGAKFNQIWTMRNPGPYAWPTGCSVRFVGGDNMLNVDNNHPAAVTDIANASESNVLARPVKVGEMVGFTVTLKAPTREGKCISYWRMKSADGTPFGHRLWCDVEVKKPVEAAPAPEVRIAPVVPRSQNAGFDYSQQQQLSRMQALRQSQVQSMWQQQQLLVNQQRAVQQAHQQAQQQAASNATLPPAYDPTTNPANIASRIAAMREQQAKRREHMMAQFNAHRDQLQAQGIKREEMPGWNQHFNPVIGTSSEPSDEEKARKEAARARVEHIKAKILRAREEKAKLLEAAQAAKEAADKERLATEAKVAEKEVHEADAKKDETEDIEGSQMVFPKLEKESPSSSTYESITSSTNKGKAAYVENEQGEVERSASPVSAAVPDVASPSIEEDFEDLDDLEVLSANGEESEDDGFLTDEEYDILDASDTETVASK